MMAPFDAALIVSALVIAAPLLIAATGELVSEKAGVLNVGLEGMILTGAFAAYFVTAETSSLLLGFVGGVVAGASMGAVMAVLAIDGRANQIVVGIAINLVAVGLTSFLNDQLFAGGRSEPITPLGGIAVPWLSGLGSFGEALFDRDVVVYLSVILLGAVAWSIYRTPWGIVLRSVGENPAAADAAGINVRGVRWAATMFAGACAGVAGAYLSIGDVGVFRNEMTAGRGFLALAAVLFGRWNPFGALAAVALFAVTDALQLRLQGFESVPASVWWVLALVVVVGVAVVHRVSGASQHRLLPAATTWVPALAACGVSIVLATTELDVTIPTPLWLATPFILALVALAVSGRRGSSMPSALTEPYNRE